METTILYTDKDTIGEILPDGTIEKEYYGQGFIYKNFKAFQDKSDHVCYISEHDEDQIAPGVGYTYKDFLEIAKEYVNDNEDVKDYLKTKYAEGITIHDIAADIFDTVDWQTPHCLIAGWEDSGAYTE